MAVVRQQRRPVAAAHSVVHPKNEQVIEIQAVTDVSEETNSRQIYVAFSSTASRQQENQQNCGEEGVNTGELQSRSQRAISGGYSEWPARDSGNN